MAHRARQYMKNSWPSLIKKEIRRVKGVRRNKLWTTIQMDRLMLQIYIEVLQFYDPGTFPIVRTMCGWRLSGQKTDTWTWQVYDVDGEGGPAGEWPSAWKYHLLSFQTINLSRRPRKELLRRELRNYWHQYLGSLHHRDFPTTKKSFENIWFSQ